MMYFAYGSNMDWNQMRERCPSATFVCVAKLPAHRLAFTRRSIKRGCGVADAIPDDRRDVWGVVYEIVQVDVGNLDQSEGFSPGRQKNAYTREERHVFVEGDHSKPVAACIYFARKEKSPPPPSPDYKGLIINAARFWHLPAEYIASLEKIET